MRPAPEWPKEAYDRRALPERVLQFGTGALLRAVAAAAVDAANRAGAFNGRITVVQSTASGLARTINAQDGLFTLAEQGRRVQRTRVVGSISRALIADEEWQLVRDTIARPELQLIVSNVTEAGFRPGEDETGWRADRVVAPATYPAKLTDLLFTRYRALGGGPPLYVIPTELLPGNGPWLAGMIDHLARRWPDADGFRSWIAERVRFCSSLVDRITTGAPSPERRLVLESQLGYHDALLTVTEPYSLWAIETDPVALRSVFAIDAASNDDVIFAPDIDFYRERKLRLLNGAHTALAPLALMAGVRTVREATEHRTLGPLLRQILGDEIAPSTTLTSEAAQQFVTSVLDRFSNPWLDHEWRVIATHQTAKLRIRVIPSIVDYHLKRRQLPPGLVLATAGSLRLVRVTGRSSSTERRGWWGGKAYPIVDAELGLVDRHWREADPDGVAGTVAPAVLERFAASVLRDTAICGHDLAVIPGFRDALVQTLIRLERDGVDSAVMAAEARRQGNLATE